MVSVGTSAVTAWPSAFGYGVQPVVVSPSARFAAGFVGSDMLSATLETKLPPLSSSATSETPLTVKVPVDPAGALKAMVFAPATSHCGLISSICWVQLADDASAKPPCTGPPLIERTACTHEDNPSTE